MIKIFEIAAIPPSDSDDTAYFLVKAESRDIAIGKVRAFYRNNDEMIYRQPNTRFRCEIANFDDTGVLCI